MSSGTASPADPPATTADVHCDDVPGPDERLHLAPDSGYVAAGVCGDFRDRLGSSIGQHLDHRPPSWPGFALRRRWRPCLRGRDDLDHRSGAVDAHLTPSRLDNRARRSDRVGLAHRGPQDGVPVGDAVRAPGTQEEQRAPRLRESGRHASPVHRGRRRRSSGALIVVPSAWSAVSRLTPARPATSRRERRQPRRCTASSRRPTASLLSTTTAIAIVTAAPMASTAPPAAATAATRTSRRITAALAVLDLPDGGVECRGRGTIGLRSSREPGGDRDIAPRTGPAHDYRIVVVACRPAGPLIEPPLIEGDPGPGAGHAPAIRGVDATGVFQASRRRSSCCRSSPTAPTRFRQLRAARAREPPAAGGASTSDLNRSAAAARSSPSGFEAWVPVVSVPPSAAVRSASPGWGAPAWGCAFGS